MRLSFLLALLAVVAVPHDSHAGSVGLECTVQLINPDCTSPATPGESAVDSPEYVSGVWTSTQPVHLAVRCWSGCVFGNCGTCDPSSVTNYVRLASDDVWLESTGFYCPQGEVLMTDAPLASGTYEVNWDKYLGGYGTYFGFEVVDGGTEYVGASCATDADCAACSVCDGGTCGLGAASCSEPYPISPDPLTRFEQYSSIPAECQDEGCATSSSGPSGVWLTLMALGLLAIWRRRSVGRVVR